MLILLAFSFPSFYSKTRTLLKDSEEVLHLQGSILGEVGAVDPILVEAVAKYSPEDFKII